jgi:hypothetical protein
VPVADATDPSFRPPWQALSKEILWDLWTVEQREIQVPACGRDRLIVILIYVIVRSCRSVRFIIFDRYADIVAQSQSEFPQYYPNPG